MSAESRFSNGGVVLRLGRAGLARTLLELSTSTESSELAFGSGFRSKRALGGDYS